MRAVRGSGIVVTAGLLLLCGCGGAGDPTATSPTQRPEVTTGPTDPTPSPPGGTTDAAESSPTPAPTPTVPPETPDLTPVPGATAAPGKPTSLTGVPTEGVESGCLVLSGHLLVGGPRDLLGSGQRLQITGQVEPNLMTTCQQGVPFVVESAEPA